MAGPRVLLAGGGTGGHLYPALNVAAALRRVDPTVECFFLGSERGIEARVLPGTGYPYRLLPLQPLYRARPWRNWRLLWSAPAVLAGLRRAFRDFRPSLVLGTGGYVSGPAVAWAHHRGLPTALQEQNAEPGLVTRLLAPRVDQVHLGYPEAERRLRVRPGTRVHAFGNPVALPEPGGAARAEAPEFAWPGGRTLLVVGGSQGARGLNLRLLEDLERRAGSGSAAETVSGPRARRGPGGTSTVASAPPSSHEQGWPAGLSVVWVAGPDHAAEVRRRVDRLPWADRVRVMPFIEDLGRQLGHATLAVSRSGAMLVAELCAAGRPAVFVPFPAAAGGHQSANARALAAAGAARVYEEADLRPGELWGACTEILADEVGLARMAAAARARGKPDAALRIAQALLELPAEGAP